MIGHYRHRSAWSVIAAAAGTAIAVAAAGCGGAGTQPGHPSLAPPTRAVPSASPLAPLAVYRNAVHVAARDHLRVWIEADMVQRWQQGKASFRAAVSQVAALAKLPGVVGIKIADELGYNDGMNSAGEIRQFLSDTATTLHAAAPHKLLLADMVVPELGCLPDHQPALAPALACGAAAQARFPALALPAVTSYLRMHAIDVLDLSTGLLSDSTYASWGTTSDTAQVAAWQQVSRLGWPALVRLQARKALAHPGRYDSTSAQAATDVRLFVDIPLAYGARAVDIWTWHQEYDGAMYQLMNPGMRPNALWDQLAQQRRAGHVLFTHMSPHSVASGVDRDLATIATVFADIFLPAGTG
ncbi:MAG TPA: hypothetical protein VGH77_17740 [Streptosporangiaceae bacterium]|jgi:hypothetical protein